eukprot:gb/GEZN01005306.1/.p1 GENE.gb/GEZN01005306.1/~~gb/GEZN01005306.1/.p1  ORF type:complete len:579 (+),score=130.81 gb/GEZN01005306.1/:33-1769(+)
MDKRDMAKILGGKRKMLPDGRVVATAEEQSKKHKAQTSEESGEMKKEALDQLPAEDDTEAILQMIESAPEIKLDMDQVKSLVSRFEKAVNKNVEMRTKFASEPRKFMDSELSLHEAIVALSPIAASPELFPVLVELKAVPTLLSMMKHENTDIAVAVVKLLGDFLDEDTLAEEEALLLLDSVLAHDGIIIMVDTLQRLDETSFEDAQAVHLILGVFENLLDVKPDLCESIAIAVMDWLLSRLKQDEFDMNKLYASEIITIFLQTGGEKIKKLFGDKEGMKRVVRALAKYRKVDPADGNEEEFVENLFHALCFALNEFSENQLAFSKADGLQLMITMIKRKTYARTSALKALDFALTDSQVNCEKFVDISGLKTLFSVFMGKGKKSSKTIAQTQEHVVSMLAQLFINLSDVRYLRLLKKFQENEYEKVERLIELYEEWYKKIEEVENKVVRRAKREGRMNDEDEETRYLRRIDAGLFTLQLIAFVLGFVSTSGDQKLKRRVEQLLNQQDSSLTNVCKILEEYNKEIGNPKEKQKFKAIVQAVIGMLGGVVESVEEEDSADVTMEAEAGDSSSSSNQTVS